MDGLPATLGHVSSPVWGLAHVMGVGVGMVVPSGSRQPFGLCVPSCVERPGRGYTRPRTEPCSRCVIGG